MSIGFSYVARAYEWARIHQSFSHLIVTLPIYLFIAVHSTLAKLFATVGKGSKHSRIMLLFK